MYSEGMGDMKNLYAMALDQTLASTPPIKGADPFEIVFVNLLPIPISVARKSEDGHMSPLPDDIPPKGRSKPLSDGAVGQRYVVTAAHTGALCNVFDVTKDRAEACRDGGPLELFARAELLRRPNDVEIYPEPNNEMIIPPDSPRMLVGVGTIGEPVVLREQFWRRGDDSYSLAPNEERTVSVTHTSGRDETSSDVETTSAAISASASGSWGVVSASVSAALSKSSTSMHQLTVRTEETRYESVVLKNEEKKPVMFLTWQLVDIVTIFEKATEQTPRAVIEQIQRPVLVAGPYDPKNLPDPPKLNHLEGSKTRRR